jgi:hypothetical protein
MPTGSWRARSMLASSYCCPEKPFVLKIRPFVLKIQTVRQIPSCMDVVEEPNFASGRVHAP